MLFGPILFNSSDHEGELRRLRMQLTSRRVVENNQDANIEALWTENHELKIYLRALIHLLTSKKLLSADEIAQMARLIERSAEPENRPPLNSPANYADTSPELQEIQKAVAESGQKSDDGNSAREI